MTDTQTKEMAQNEDPFTKGEWIEATEEELKNDISQLYDRQAFIGHQVQQSLFKSNILIIEFTGSNTELAKDLILAGANITIYDEANVNQQDLETNFLITEKDLGEKRGKVGQRELHEMNPLVKIEYIDVLPEPNNWGVFDIIVTSTTSFKKMKYYDELAQKLNKPYYNLVCCGFYGYIYISLGQEFKFTREKRIIKKITWTQGKVIEKQKEPEYREFEEVIASSLPINQLLSEKHRCQNNVIYYCILMMHKAEETMGELPKELSEEQLKQVVTIGNDIYKEVLEKEPTEAVTEKFRQFASNYGIDFCPVYSILGSIASQELIAVLGRQSQPALNWFCYDSIDGYGIVEVLQNQEEFKIKDLPERRQLISEE